MAGENFFFPKRTFERTKKVPILLKVSSKETRFLSSRLRLINAQSND